MGPRSDNRGYALQSDRRFATGSSASMGPRSDNRGYAFRPAYAGRRATELQWVHGPITVVMVHWLVIAIRTHAGFNGSTVREPWLCCTGLQAILSGIAMLQWVHGPRTVVM